MYKKKAILFLMILLVLFSFVFMIALLNFNKGISFIHLGMGAKNENIVLMVLSIMGVVWALVELIQWERQ